MVSTRQNVIVIPARFPSTRLPGKPMVVINGKSMLQRVWMLAKAVKNSDEVFIATDDKRIQDHAHSFGAEVIMTDPSCPTGTDRVYAAVSQLSYTPEIIINFQGDAVLTPPWIIQDLIDAMIQDKNVETATLAAQLTWEKYDELVKSKASSKSSGTTVTFDKNCYALYFSKSIIPFVRNKDQNSASSPVFKHIGMYGYRFDALKKFVSLPQTPLEKVESLEQLRLLENGIKIKIVLADTKGKTMWGVDSPEDVNKVEEIIAREGELLVF
jgi:3-deoxy-manno-octulosonate cytidylyltransferase (CMP-KDO synthetase)